jgi:plasmid maintenance system antidote protein VapI
MTPKSVTHSVLTALDKAAAMLGNDSRTAEALHMPRQNISEVRQGKRALTVEQVAALSQLLDCDPQELLAANALHRVKDAKERTRLERVFFSFVGLGAVATFGLYGTSPDTNSALQHAIGYFDPIYIVACSLLLACYGMKRVMTTATTRAMTIQVRT